MLKNGLAYKIMYDKCEYMEKEHYQKNTVLVVDSRGINNKEGQMNIVMTRDEKQGISDIVIDGYDIRIGREVVCMKSDVLGELRPECMTEHDRMFLASYKPITDKNIGLIQSLGFAAYCFLKDERYHGPVLIRTQDELKAYIDIQKKYQYLIRVCDADDYIVMEIEDGELMYPTKEMILQEQNKSLEREEE